MQSHFELISRKSIGSMYVFIENRLLLYKGNVKFKLFKITLMSEN